MDLEEITSMNSFNHYSFGAVAAWMLNYSLGIRRDPDQSAFKKFVLNPRPDPNQDMKWAKGYVETIYGKISSEWRWMKDQFSFNVEIPANTSAKVILPAGSNLITESGKAIDLADGITISSTNDHSTVLELVSGKFNFLISS